MPSGSFTVNANITDNDLQRHYRDRDHQGQEPDTDVITTEEIAGYPAGTTLDQVLIALWERAQ